MKTKESYRWVICGAATLMIFCAVGIGCSAFAFHLPYVRNVNGFTDTQTSMLLTIQSFSSIGVSLIVDRFYKRVSLRFGITVAISFLTAAFLLYGLATSYVVFCIGSVLSGISCGLAGTTAAAYLINTWFSDNRAFAMGIASAGTGLASVIAPQILAPIIENVSLSAAFLAETGFILFSTLLLFLVVRKGPYSLSGVRASAPAVSATPSDSKALFIFSGKRTVQFMVGLFFLGFLVHGVTAALSLILAESFSGADRAHLVSVFGFSVMAGKMLCGKLYDRFGRYRTNFIFYSFLGIGLILVCLAKTFPLGLLSTLFLGLGSPFATVSLPAYIADFAREETYPKALKYGNLTMTIARMIFTTIAGASADIFGSYVPLFAVMSILTPVTAFLIQNIYAACGMHRKQG